MVRKVILPLLLAFTSSLFAQVQDARVVTRIVTDTVPTWKTWKGEGCSMTYPGTWHAGPAQSGDTIVVFRTVESDGAPGACVSVIIRDADRKGDPSKELPKGLKTITSEGSDENGVHTKEFSVKMDGVTLHGAERVMKQDGTTYILTYMASPEAYDEHLFIAEAMMKSFSLPSDN